MPFLCVLLRGTLERFVGSDHDARRLLDVLDRHRCPAVRLHFGNFTLSPGDERGSAPAAVVQEQHAPTVRALGLMPGRKGHLTGIANPLGEIDEGHQARDCITWLSSTSFRVERVDHACSSNAFSSLLPPR